jgi:dihydroorotate dehydrogenase (fumarate)
MADMTTHYLGSEITNPLVVGSSGLTGDLDGVRRCADAGAGAVVLVSLFEQTAGIQVRSRERDLWLDGYQELPPPSDAGRGIEGYLRLVEKSKKAIEIPVIASLNCVTGEWWGAYASDVAAAGADAIELNLAYMSHTPLFRSSEIEKLHVRIVDDVKEQVHIPVVVKLAPYYTALARTATELCLHGADALVLFNRFRSFDIDIDRLAPVHGSAAAGTAEPSEALRWIALLSGRIDCDLAASGGVEGCSEVIKYLLAGARVVQLSSSLYGHGVGYITRILGELSTWMEERGFGKIDDMYGLLAQRRSNTPRTYEDIQYTETDPALHQK